MKYLFVYINSVNGVVTGADYEINCSYIRSYLKGKNIEAEQFIYRKTNAYLNQDYFTNAIAEIEGNFQIVVYINEYNFYISKVYINQIKKCLSNRIICIGPSSGYIAHNLYNDLKCDIFIEGEPYYALERLYQCKNPLDIEDVTRLDTGAILYNQENIEVDYASINHPYSNGILPAEEIFNVGLYSSKGCTGNCCFCSYSNKRKVSCFSEKSVVDELIYIKSQVGSYDGTIMFLDDCFSASEQRIIDICKGICDNNIGYKFWCTTRTDTLSFRAMDELKRSNFNVVIGLETPSQELLKTTGKLIGIDENVFIENVLEQYKYAESIGLDASITFMFYLPNEIMNDVNNTLSFIEKNSLKNISISIMTLFPSSRIFKKYQNDELLLTSPTCLPVRTTNLQYDGKLLWKALMNNSFYKKQYKVTSMIHTLYCDYIEQFTGLNSNRLLKNKKFIKGVNINQTLDNPNIIKWLANITDSDSSVLLVSDTLTKANNKLYCDDRKHLRVAIKEYDEVLSSFYANNYYCEKLSIAVPQGDNVYKIKLGEDYEQVLKKKTFLDIANDSFEHKIEQCYDKFISNTEFTIDDFDIITFKNSCILSNCCTAFSARRISIRDDSAYLCDLYKIKDFSNYTKDTELLSEKNISKMINEVDLDCTKCEFNSQCSKCSLIGKDYRKRICSLRKKCDRIYQLVNISGFIVKNFSDINSNFIVYSYLNSKNIYDTNMINSNIAFILLYNIGYIYNSDTREYIILDYYESINIDNMFKNSYLIYNNTKLYNKIMNINM